MKTIQISDDLFYEINRRLAEAGLSVEEPSHAIVSTLALLGGESGETVCQWIAGQLSAEGKPKRPARNALELASAIGIVGAVDGPVDFSTNQAHLEGLGQ